MSSKEGTYQSGQGASFSERGEVCAPESAGAIRGKAVITRQMLCVFRRKKVLNYQYNKQMVLKIQMESSKYLEVGYETNSQDSGQREYLDSAFVYRCGLWFHGCFSAVEKAPVSCLAVFALQLFALSDSRHVAYLTCEICEIESEALVCVFCFWDGILLVCFWRGYLLYPWEILLTVMGVLLAQLWETRRQLGQGRETIDI